MRESRYSWQVTETETVPATFSNWLTENNKPAIFAELLWQRGVRSEEALNRFFNPSLAELHDPYLMHGMTKAVERIQRAVAEGERILIYGDYDADGITSTTVMKEAIDLLGGEVVFYLPNRFSDGYGPNKATYARLIEELEIQLIVTVDNGVSGHEAIAFAQEQGVDVVVTDHHELPAELPAAYTIVHPQHPEGNYPFKDLAGVGVAFKVATALLEEIPQEMLDLVALGTVADLVSLTGENRVLVQLGLEVMKQSDRIGLQALAAVAGLKLPTLTDENIGFGLVPRLNALGRLGDANPGVDLLSTFDEEEAQSLAQMLEDNNQQRKDIGKNITAEALAMVKEMPAHEIYVLAKAGWHEGVLGIVASSVVEATGRPALVLAIDEEKQIAKGSGRGVEAVNLHGALSSAADLFINFGGHQMAAGMTLPLDRLDDLQTALDAYVREAGIDFSAGPSLEVAGELALKDITVELISQLNLLSPFGTDNPSPYFLFKDYQVAAAKQLGLDKKTLKFELRDEENSLDCIGFGFGTDCFEFEAAEKINVLGQLKLNEWNGRRKPQVMVKDYQIDEFQVFDLRGKPLKLSDFDSATLFVYFEEKNKSLFEATPAVRTLFAGDLSGQEKVKEVVFVDCPLEAEALKKIVTDLKADRIYLILDSKEQAYLNGMPQREHFAKLFNFIHQHQNVDVRYKLAGVANYLKIKENLLIFMIQVFFELGFVTIEGGVMNQVVQPTTRPLTESQAYQARELKIKAEEFLLFSSLTEIRQWLLSQEEEN